ncbi:hemolysin III family protein [Thioclava sp. GXIMD4215]|uniref:PAQR family membrane homeostasis protein TrhA n=1 Tax=Thioclava sp. GXIMD4215 TaxID=3131928 RepID=UPI0032492702
MNRYRLPHSLREHVADGVMHVLGLVTVIAGISGLLVWAALTGPVTHIWPLAIYAGGLLASFGFSAAYNLTLHAPTRAVLRRFDHAAIYLLIAGTYTPMALLGLEGRTGWALAIASWVIAGIGLVMKLGFFNRWHRLGFVMYLAMGWIGLVASYPIVTSLPLTVVILIVTGGLIYTAGTVFHVIERIPFSRAIWHGHVLAAAVTHFIAIVLLAAPA